MSDEYRLLGREERTLRCVLTRDELLERGQEAAELRAKADELEADRDAASKSAKGQIAKLDDRCTLLLREVREKATEREVECEIRLDVLQKVVQTIRTDTGEVVQERRATAAELQGKLFPMARDGSAQL